MKTLGYFSIAFIMAAGLSPCLIHTGGQAAQPQQKKGSGFASDRPSAVEPVQIDHKRVMEYLRQICDIGPRQSGSKGMEKQQELLRNHFQQHGGQVQLQTFTARQESRSDKPVEMANMIISYFPQRQRRVIICAHYDTRPIADQEPDPRKWREPFVSANDGGSGVALMMELAHHVRDLKTNVGVDFVFFDGEEFIFDPDRDKYFFGSQHFAKAWRSKRQRPEYIAAILLDMIGGKGAKFPAEGYSYNRARELTNTLWNIAAEQRCNVFQRQIGDHVRDDHLALQDAGIPAVDIIDFSYPHWHRLTDTPENCSAEPMDQVARVLTVFLQRVK